MCAKYPKEHPYRPYRHLLVDDRHRVIFCPIPKVGCTNWKSMLVRLSGNYRGNPNRRIHVHKHGTMHKYGISHLSEYPPEERQWRLQNYSTFMFARNPYERTLSGYRNKMLERDWWFIRKYGRLIKQYFRGSQKGGRVRFNEFVRYLIKLHQDGGHFNVHWAKYHTICHPCEIDYDYIGKMETMDADADYIIRKFYEWRCPPKFPQMKSGHKTTNKVTSLWYSNLTQPLIDGLYKVYEKDFQLFGYDKIPPKIWLLWTTEIMVSVTLEPDSYISLRPRYT